MICIRVGLHGRRELGQCQQRILRGALLLKLLKERAGLEVGLVVRLIGIGGEE